MTRRPGDFGARRALVGALMFALIVFAVYIAFGSTRGVPFVPTYTLTVEVPDAAQLKPGADVLVAGKRVGQVKEIAPVAVEGEKPAAQVKIALENGFGPLPEDSTFGVHLTGAFGRKAIEIQPGTSNETLADNDTVPLTDADREIVDIDQVLNAFDEGAREGTRQTIEALGTGAAGRGAELNVALEHLPQTLAEAQPSMRTLSAPGTQLGRFTSSLTALGAELAPTSTVIPGLVTDLDSTFTALNSVGTPYLQETIEGTAKTFGELPGTLARTRPLLRSGTALFAALRPGVATLPETAPVLNQAIEAGIENLPRVPGLSERLSAVLEETADFGDAPASGPGLRRLAQTMRSLESPLSFLTPAESRCKYASLLIRNLSSVVTEDFATGTSVRASGVVVDVERNAERGPAAAISQGPVRKALGPVHSNPYPNTAAPGQTFECEAGNEPYITSRTVIGNVPSTQESTTEDAATLP